MIAVVDYGLGNVRAFLNVYRRLNVEATPAAAPADLVSATKIILPGVGAFNHAMKQLDDSGMRPTLDELVLERNVPVLGVCVGMQMLARSSDEGQRPGLGWIPGEVKRFDATPRSAQVRTPHMGWNDVHPTSGNRLFASLESDARFYFLHSYYFQCDRPDDAIAVSEYGSTFSSAVGAGNIYGVQFHPEKSHHYGARLLQNFAEL
jgi:glutamine amidotransferase